MNATMKPRIWLEISEPIEFEAMDGSDEKWTLTVRNWLCQLDGDEICLSGETPRQAYLFWLHSKLAEARFAINRMERELKRLTS